MTSEGYVCPRCGTAAAGASTCGECGLDLDAQEALPTAEEFAAGGIDAAREAREREAAELDAAAAEHAEYRSPRVRGHVLQLWLVGSIFVDVALGGLSAVHLGLLEEATLRDPARLEELRASDDRLVMAAIVALVVFVVTSVFFIAWLHRAYKNLSALGCRDRRHRLGWAIGGWFIPVVAWIIPKRIVDDIWRCNVERDSAPELPWRRRRVPAWVHFWWFLFILGGLLGNASYRAYDDGTLDGERTSTLIDLIATPVWMAGAGLAWLVVDRITKAQDAAAEATPGSGALTR